MSKPETNEPGGFFRYEDDNGDLHIVDDLASVPQKFRGDVEKVESTGPRDLFSFEDEEGHTLIADSIEAVPKEFRDLAKSITKTDAREVVAKLEKTATKLGSKGMVRAKEAQREVGDVVPFVKDLDIPSVMFGFAMALVIGFVMSLMRRTGRTFAKVGMVLLIVAIVAGSYFAWIRRVAGLGETRLASPTAMIDDAQKAADAMRAKIDKQQGILKQLEENER